MRDKTKIKQNPRIATNFIGWDVKTKFKNQNIDGWGICTDSNEAKEECLKETIVYNKTPGLQKMGQNEIDNFNKSKHTNLKNFCSY